MPRGRRATELRCAAGYEGERLGDKGHEGQEDRASKPQGLRGDFILRKVGRHRGLWSMELGVWFILVVSFRIE